MNSNVKIKKLGILQTTLYAIAWILSIYFTWQWMQPSNMMEGLSFLVASFTTGYIVSIFGGVLSSIITSIIEA